MAEQGNDFEGCSEWVCQQLGEAGVFEEGDPQEKLPRGVAEHGPLRYLGEESYPQHQVSSEVVESCRGLWDPGVHHGQMGSQLHGGQAQAPFDKVCSDQPPEPS